MIIKAFSRGGPHDPAATSARHRHPQGGGEDAADIRAHLGVSPDISEKPDLTMDEANAAVGVARVAEQAARDAEYDRRRGEIPTPHTRVLEAEDGSIKAVGVFYYSKPLRAVFKRHQVSDRRAIVWAQLVREPDNEHDENAVAIHVDGVKVGHLSADEAEDVCDTLDLLDASLVVPGAICGDAGEGDFAVFLDLDLDELVDALGERGIAAPTLEELRQALDHQRARQRQSQLRTALALAKGVAYAAAALAVLWVLALIVMVVLPAVWGVIYGLFDFVRLWLTT